MCESFLRPYQEEAVRKMSNGCILCGGVGSGKSRTALAFVAKKYPQYLDNVCIITTARKRDTNEWDNEVDILNVTYCCPNNIPQMYPCIDSWNNIGKYQDEKDAFFIFDEQRVVGKGAWVKSFLKIAKNNHWILLSATPGDKWEDYIPVFMANGFFRTRSQFNEEHIVFSPYSKFPQVQRYLNTGRLIRLRNQILVTMNYQTPAVCNHTDIWCDYNIPLYKKVYRDRWSEDKDAPIESASEFCYELRKVVNSDISREYAVMRLFNKYQKVIIFYNFDYELDILRRIKYGKNVRVAEWNGHAHEPIPKCSKWVYLVQYTAGAEGWNCIDTNCIVFYSQNYSYKSMEQAAGRINRLNTPFTDLYFYHLKSHSSIDMAIDRALKNKRDFNAMGFVNVKTIKGV